MLSVRSICCAYCRFVGGSIRLRQIRPEHAVAAGREYTAAQRAKAPPLPPPRELDPAPMGKIRRVWIWGELLP